MIENKRQYNMTLAQLNKLEQALVYQKCHKDNIASPLIYKAIIEALESQMADLRSELAEFIQRRAE